MPRLFTAALWLAASAVANAAPVVVPTISSLADGASAPAFRPPAAGWTLPEAVRAVALGDPTRTLPPALAASPASAPVWAAAAARIAAAPAMNRSAQEMVRAALEEVADAAPGRPAGPAPAERSRAVADEGARVLAAADADPALLVAQYGVQHHKDLIRTIKEYDDSIALRRSTVYSRPNPSYESSRAVVRPAESLLPLLRAESPLRAMVDDLRARHGRVVWADAGGGLGAAQREWSRKGLGADVRRVLVDLFDWERLSSERLAHAARLLGRRTFAARHRPDVLLADAAAVRFPPGERPNLITSIESIQYWPDKLGGLINLYNQLEDGGILVVSAEHAWPTWIRTKGSVISHTSTVFDDFIAALARAGVEVAAVVPDGHSPAEDARALVIRKKPGTRLIQDARLLDLWVNPYGYSASYYGKLRAGRPPVRVAD